MALMITAVIESTGSVISVVTIVCYHHGYRNCLLLACSHCDYH